MHRYYSLLGDELWTINLTENEAAAFVDAMRNARADVTWCGHLWEHVADNLRAWTHGLDDPTQFIDKFRGLTPGQTMALMDAAERYWSDGPNPEEFELAALKNVGLVKPWV